jgi:hypothetical protein
VDISWKKLRVLDLRFLWFSFYIALRFLWVRQREGLINVM